MRIVLLFLFFPLLIGAAAALSFTAPAEGATFQGTTNVTFSWDAPAVTFAITGSSPVDINSTSTTRELGPGTYTATITASNETANRTVIVQAVQQVLTITTDKSTYEAGTSSRITVTASQPAQLSLSISVNGTVVDTYTINVQQQTEFLYTLTRTGTYTAAVTGQGASATTSFTSQNTSVVLALSGSNQATAGRVTTYQSSVSGGTPPYTYNWQFSDNTSSSGSTADHVFATPGNYTVTLLVQDSTGKQASKTMTVTVSELIVRLDVTVMGKGNLLLEDALVAIADSRGGRSAYTDEFGEVTFRNLSVSNYSVNVSYNKSGVSYFNSTTIALTENDNLLLRLGVPDPSQSTTTNNTSNQTSSTTTAPATLASAPEESSGATTGMAADSTEPAPLAAKQVSTDSFLFEQTRTEALNELQGIEEGLAHTSEKSAILTTLGLSEGFEAARARVSSADSASGIEEALASVPTDVTVLSKDTNVEQRAMIDALDDLETLQGIRGGDEGDQKKLRYNVEHELANTTITSKRVVARVAFHDGSSKTYTLFSKSIKASAGVTFVEFIPKAIASDASKLHVDGSHEVLQADPVLRFLSTDYSYYVEGEAPRWAAVTTLPVPLELAEPPSFIGFVAVKLRLDSFARGGLYAGILAFILVAVVAGNVLVRRSRVESSLPAFTELAELTLSTVEGGHYDIVGRYCKELQTIHASLTEQERAATADIMGFITDAAAVQTFRASIDHLDNIIALGDTTAIGTAYERVMEHFDKLSEASQQREQATIATVNARLENHLERHEVNQG